MVSIILVCLTLIIPGIILCRRIIEYYILREKLSVLPGPRSLPFIGMTWQIISIPPEERLEWLNNVCRKFKKGMTLTWIGTNPIVIIDTPKYMEIVLSSNTLITKSMIYDIMRPWLGNGLVTSTGDRWFKHRRLITPAFHVNVLEEYAATMREKVQILIECIELQLQKDNNAPINIFKMSIRYTLDTICEAAMGVKIDSQRESDNEYVNAFHNFSELSLERYFRFWLKWNVIYYCTPKGREYLRAMKIMHDYTETVIQQKQLKRKKQKNLSTRNGDVSQIDEYDKRNRRAFLDLLLDASEKSDNPLTFQDIREEVDTFMFAGHDTTAAAITWTLFAIGNNPEVQNKIQQEINELFEDKTEMLSTKDLDQLKYLDRVIKESLRLYPSAPLIGRRLGADTVIDGYVIPKGTILNMNFYQLHRNPEVWENSEKFDPDRFLPENSRLRSPYAYSPFSAGPRNCIGQKFAMLELKNVLTAILRKWRVFSVKKPSEVKMVLNFTLRPHEEKLELYFKPLGKLYQKKDVDS